MEKGRKVQYLVTLAVSLSALTSGVCLNWSTPVIPKFHDNSAGFNITTEEISWMASIGSTGFMAGSVLTRYTADTIGRRGTILSSALPFIFGTIIILNMTTAWMLYVTRFAWGISAGMIGTVSGIYMVEISDKEIRGTLSSANRFMLNFGSSLVMAVGPFVSFQVLSYMLLVLPICYFVACLFVPETPYYYLKQGKVDAARKSLAMLTGSGDEKALEDRLSTMRSDVRKETLRSGTVMELFTGKQYRKAMIIVIGLKFTQIMSGSTAIAQYFGRIIQETSTKISVSTALIVFGALRLFVGMFSLTLVDRIGRRPLLSYSYLLSGIALAIVGACFIGDAASSTYYNIIPFIGLLCNAIITDIGYGPLGFIIPAELFPVNVKSVAMTFVSLLSGFLNFVSVKEYQELKDVTGLTGVFWIFGSIALIGAVFSHFFVPETKGKSLREIQIELQGKIHDEAGEKLHQALENGDVVDIQFKVGKQKDTSTSCREDDKIMVIVKAERA